MATDVTKPRMSAIVVPDPRVEIWDTHSSFTTAGPRAGHPVPQNSTTAALSSTGTQSAGASVTIQTTRQGFPGIDGACFGWRNTSADAVTDYRGWDPPQCLHEWEAAVWTDGGSAPESFADPCAVTLANGTVLAACQVADSTTAATRYRVEVLSRSPSTGVWSRILVYSQATSPTQEYLPCLLVLPSGRIHCYFLLTSTVAGSTSMNGRMYFSDDSGATWSYGGEMWSSGETLATTLTATRMRVAYRDEQVVMLVSFQCAGGTTIMNRVAQYASSDLGNTFQRVNNVNATGTPVLPSPGPYEWIPTIDNDSTRHAAGFFEVAATALGFLVVFVANSTMYSVNLADAFQSLESADVIITDIQGPTINGGGTGTTAISDGDLAVGVDDAGVVYAYARIYGTGECVVCATYDHGLTWRAVGRSSAYGTDGGYWHYGGTTADYPKDFTATWCRGRMLLIGNWVASTGNEDGSIGVWHLGGYTSVTMPAISRLPDPRDRAAWTILWVPIEEPVDTGWTSVGTGASTEDLVTPGRLQLSAVAANTWYYRRVPSATHTLAEGLIAEFAIVIPSGGDVTLNRISANFQLGDATNQYAVDVRMSSTGYRLYDATAGTVIGSTQTIDFTAGVEIRVAMQNNDVVVWHRARSLVGSKKWTAGPTSTALADAGAGTNRVEWGLRAAGATDQDTYWYYFGFVTDYVVGQGLTGFVNPTDLMGRAFSPKPIYVDDGAYITASDGPTWMGDQWVMATRYDHEIRRALDVPSPRVSWRSTSTAQQQIAVKIREDAGEDGFGQSGTLVIGLFGSNVPQFILAGRDEDTAAWVNIDTAVNLCSGLDSLRTAITGNSARPHGSNAATNKPYFRRNELSGATFRVDSSDSRRIRSNSEGSWRVAGAGVRPTIWLDAADGTETAAPTTSAIIPANALAIVDLGGVAYSGFRLTIPAASGAVPQPAESYYEIGTLVIGWLHPLARAPDWGRALSLEAGVEITTLRDRTRVSRRVAPPARSGSISWMDGIDQGEIDRAIEADPDYVRIGSEAAAAPSAIAYALEGLLHEVGGAERPLIYVERIEPGGTTSIQNRRHQFMLCRMTSEIGRESAQGEAGYDEVVRVATVDLEEEV